MEINAGFDMVPRLTEGAADKNNWDSFIEAIKECFKEDDQVDFKVNYIEFKIGEHPQLPLEGHKFLRFSSKVSDSHAKGVQNHIDVVVQIATEHFASRVRYWCDAIEPGFYSWFEVNESFKTYEQPGELDPASMEQPVFGNDSLSELHQDLYSIEPVNGKGKGLVARFNIEKGKRILVENPLFTIPNVSPISRREEILATELKALSKSKQREFLSLHNNFPGKHPFSGILKTNALPCGPNSVIGGIYATICRINHSCIPNANHSWNSDIERETIHAARNIKPGEEITISYAGSSPSTDRLKFLKNSFGFDCNCGLCSLSPSDIEASDARRLQIEHLDKAISEGGRVMRKPGDCLTDCYNLLRLLDEEYKGCAIALVARLYYDAFQISITHGDQARAAVFAERGYNARVIGEGEDSSDAKKMKELMRNPRGHRNFGASQKWRTAVGMVPKGLDIDGFEKWLWRQNK